MQDIPFGECVNTLADLINAAHSYCMIFTAKSQHFNLRNAKVSGITIGNRVPCS